MSTAQVIVLHEIVLDGQRVQPSAAQISMPADKARELEAAGYVDVMSVDGVAEVWGACCAGHHNHGQTS